jgi:hypothetical protein
MRVSLFEIFLIQVILYTVIWLMNDYVASYMSVVIPAICLVILLIALIAEYIEPSGISRKYFWFMGISVITPLLVGGFFMFINRGYLEWMQGI